VRKTSGAIVCPSCRKLVGLNEPRCPYCGRIRPGLWGYGPAIGKIFGSLDPTSIIAAACVLLYVAALALDIRAALAPRGFGFLGILSPSSRALFTLGMTGGWAWAAGHWWTMASAIYLHGSLLHIVFNVMWIRSLGPAVEEIYGPARAFLLFQIAGVGGFLISNMIGNSPTIGASGAIFGLLGALIVHGRTAGRALMTRQVLTWAVVLFVFGFIMPGINNLAHAGGFACGWIGARVMGAGVRAREEGPGTQILAIIAAVASLAAVILSIVTTYGPAFLAR
jgi:rhomboid protease GluP